MNLKLTVAAGLLAAVSGVVLAQGTINTNNFVNNTKASNTKASQSYFTPAVNKAAQKKGWQFSYNASVGFGETDIDIGGSTGSLSLAPLSLGGSVTNGGFYAAYLGQYTYVDSGHVDGSEWDSGSYADIGYVKKLSKNSMMLATNISAGKEDSPYWNTINAVYAPDTDMTAAAAWHGLGLDYTADLSESDSNSYGLFYMKNIGKSYFTLQAAFDSDASPSFDNGMFLAGYSYNFRSDYRIGVQYFALRDADDSENLYQYSLTLSKGLNFNGITNAMRHYIAK